MPNKACRFFIWLGYPQSHENDVEQKPQKPIKNEISLIEQTTY